MSHEASPSGAADARADLDFIRGVITRTDRRVDPHAFHYVHWGAIVLLWYPLAEYFEHQENGKAMALLGIGAVVLGAVLSTVREMRLAKAPRLEGENTFVARQMMQITFLCIGAGAILSAIAPKTGFIDGPDIPTLWGLVYATMACMLGVVYRRAFLYAGLFIFAGSIAAVLLPHWNGYILGPVMGLGMIVPGLQAEARVKRLRAETATA